LTEVFGVWRGRAIGLDSRGFEDGEEQARRRGLEEWNGNSIYFLAAMLIDTHLLIIVTF
jgi:hypothetical protein